MKYAFISCQLIIYFNTSDPDTANGNSTEMTKTETVKEDNNKNEKVMKNSKNSNKKSANKMANSMPNNEPILKETESNENGKNETDKVVNVEKDKMLPANEFTAPAKPVPEETSKAEPTPFVPKYKYTEGLNIDSISTFIILN